jgi:hypothetical protein
VGKGHSNPLKREEKQARSYIKYGFKPYKNKNEIQNETLPLDDIKLTVRQNIIKDRVQSQAPKPRSVKAKSQDER